MRNTLRSIAFGLTAMLGLTAAAQYPYAVTVSGHITPCSPAIAGGTVTIATVQNTQPVQAVTVDLNENCYYTYTFNMSDATGWFQVVGSCANGTADIASGQYTANVLTGTAELVLDLDCGTITPSCQACINVHAAVDPLTGVETPWTIQVDDCSSGGLAPISVVVDYGDGTTGAPGSHTYAGPAPNGFYFVCLTMTDSEGCTDMACWDVFFDEDGNYGFNNGPCQADFWVMQAYDGNTPNGTLGEPVPFELWIWNLSSGGTAPYQYLWSFGDGTTSTDAYPTHTYPGAGPYELCLTMADASGCTSTYCDEISVDEDGLLNGMIGGGDDRSTLTINVRQPLTTGVTENSFAQLAVSPNPVADVLNITLASSLKGNVPVTVFDANGREVINIARSVVDGRNRFSVATDGLEAGVYLLRIGNGNDLVVRRFVKH